MKPIKTLTVGGETYQITDPEAARLADIVDRLCPAFTETGELVSCEPVAGYPLAVTAAEEATKIYRCGKNLFDGYWENGLMNTSTGADASNGDSIRTGYIPLIPGVTYYFTLIKGRSYYPITYDKDKKFVRYMSSRTSSFSFKANENERYLRLGQYNEKQIYESAQLEVGTTATAFEPYTGGTFAVGEAIPALSGVNTLFADTGSITVTGRADPVAVMEKLQNAVIALGGNI